MDFVDLRGLENGEVRQTRRSASMDVGELRALKNRTPKEQAEMRVTHPCFARRKPFGRRPRGAVQSFQLFELDVLEEVRIVS